MLKMYEEDSQKRGGKKKNKRVYEGNFKFPKLRSWLQRYEMKRKKGKEKGASDIKSCFNFSTTLSKDVSIKNNGDFLNT